MTERAALESRTDSQIIAPAWHTAGVLVLLLGLVVLSMHEGRGSHGEPSHRRMASYIVTMIAEWLIFAFIALGARWQGASIRTLVGAASLRWRLIARDLGLAVAFLIAANLTLGLLGYVLGRLKHPATSEALKNLLPHSRLEAAVFLLLALTAAICEEMIFRGYLQRQFTAWTKSATAGIVMQALAFGLAHAYQGSSEVILIAVYGGMFGVLAHWRGSLRPGIMAHFLQDGAGGLLAARSLLK